MITAITCTGDRPAAFELCLRWMLGQTVIPEQWIIVDDGRNPMPYSGFYRSAFVDYLRREPRPDDPKHTLNLNVRAALPAIKGDRILFIEDDEYYAPAYIETMVRHLERYQVVGIGCSKYYHLQSGYHKHRNFDHASLAQTAFRSTAMPLFKSCIAGDSFIDVRFWKKVRENKIGHVFDDDAAGSSLYCGVKGMPGRAGIGSGHIAKNDCYKRDPDYAMFKKWVHTPDPYIQLIKQFPSPLTGEGQGEGDHADAR